MNLKDNIKYTYLYNINGLVEISHFHEWCKIPEIRLLYRRVCH